MFSSEIYKSRRKRLAESLKDGLVLIPGNSELPFNYKNNPFPFRQDSTFLYFAGIDEPDLFLLMDCSTGKECLFGTPQSNDDAIWNGPVPSLSQKALTSGIDNVKETSALESELKNYKGKIHFINPYNAEIALTLSKLLGVNPLELASKQSVEMIKAIVKMRKVKSPEELKEIEQAVNLTSEMMNYVIKYAGGAEEYFNERLVVGKIYEYATSRGYFTSFPPIVTIHGEVFHNRNYSENLKRGKLLLVDAGIESLSHYAGDMTRTIPLGGRFSKRQKEIYDIVVKANWGIVDSARPGVKWPELHKRAARIITSGLKDLNLMKGDTDEIVEKGAYALFFPHGLGHLVGLDVHDMENYGEDYVGYDEKNPRSEIFGPNCLRYGLELEENMVVTDEPGIYFIPELIQRWKAENKFSEYINYDAVLKYKDFGGIRIEDDLLITSSGSRVLGVPVPKTTKDIEKAILG